MLKSSSYRLLVLSSLIVLLINPILAQSDTLATESEFDFELLRLNVPEAFQQNSLRLEVFSDSSWVLYRGQTALNFTDALVVLGQEYKIEELADHERQEALYSRDHRARRVFSSVATLVGGTYLYFIWDRDWIYQIPGYALLVVAGIRYWESRDAEIEAKRQQYYIDTILRASEAQKLVDAYNLRLYQYLSNTGIRYRDS